MNCLRCGRETQEDHVFCDSCLAEMEKYPVRPGTAVMLPRRKEKSAPKKTRRHQAPPVEDQLKKLRRQRRALIIGLCLSILVAAGSIAAAVTLSARTTPRPGQNYSAMDTTQAS